jgi:hypothetical protein
MRLLFNDIILTSMEIAVSLPTLTCMSKPDSLVVLKEIPLYHGSWMVGRPSWYTA